MIDATIVIRDSTRQPPTQAVYVVTKTRADVRALAAKWRKADPEAKITIHFYGEEEHE